MMKIKTKPSFGGMKYRTKLMAFFLLAVSIIMLASLFAYLSSQILMGDTNQMLKKNLELTVAYSRLEKVQNDIEIYLSTSSSDSLIAFYNDSSSLNENASGLLSEVSYTERGIKIKNVANMILNYLDKAEAAINEKRGRNIPAYTADYEETVKESDYITVYMEEIMSRDVIDSSEKFEEISIRQQNTSLLNDILIACVMGFVIAMIILFSFEVTKPITRLAGYAQRIADGDFDIAIQPDRTSGEIHTLYRVFASMVVSIREYVDQIQEKRRLERTLSEEKLNNLKMKNALHESELLALQSQVNPHFIFNTINIGAKIAMLQGDRATCTYLENAADIFRYNLNGLDSNATLKQEIDNVVSYMYLLQMRFGDTIRFSLEADETDSELMGLTVPRMTLQPLVENAYIHGISKLEEGGTIRLRAWKEGKLAHVEVCDSGSGLAPEQIESILNGSPEDAGDGRPHERGHTTGIGLDNVLKRLRLFFDRRDVMWIDCAGGLTKFILVLPLNCEGGGENVPGADR